MWGLHVSSKMAEQEGKRLIYCITDMRLLEILASVLFQNSFVLVLWERGTYSKDFEHICEKWDEKTRNFPPIEFRMK